MTEIESARKYVEDVFADIQQARETYPFIEATLLPTVDPVPIQLKVAAVNKALLERTHAKCEDFAGPYSRELEIIVPFDYKKTGCKRKVDRYKTGQRRVSTFQRQKERRLLSVLCRCSGVIFANGKCNTGKYKNSGKDVDSLRTIPDRGNQVIRAECIFAWNERN